MNTTESPTFKSCEAEVVHSPVVIAIEETVKAPSNIQATPPVPSVSVDIANCVM